MRQKLNKLRHMSLGELTFRVREAWQVKRESRRVRGGRASSHPPCGLRRIAQLVPGGHPSERQRLAEQAPQLRDHFLALYQQRPSTLFGKPFDFSTASWHHQPFTEKSWPLEFYAATLKQRVGDLKYVWEAARFQEHAIKAQQASLSGDPALLTSVHNDILNWIEANPYLMGIHWTSALEVAMRAMSWLWILSLGSHTHDNQGVLDPAGLERITASLADHAEYLSHHPSRYSSPYNHLIGELTALLMLSLFLEHPHSLAWREQASGLLEATISEQFHQEGLTVEQAMGYHFYSLGFLLQALHTANIFDLELPNSRRQAEAGLQLAEHMRLPNGLWPTFGDIDSARSIPTPYDEYWNFSSLLHFGQQCLGLPNLPQSQLPLDSYWLLGVNGVIAGSTDERTPASSSHETRGRTCEPRRLHLEDAGYVIARNHEDWLHFDVGPTAHGLHADETPSTAHGHADQLQVLLGMAGQPLTIDPGIPTYYEPKEWIAYFRSAAAHNTLSVEGLGPVQDAGGLAWCRERSRPRVETHLSEDLWIARAWVNWDSVVLMRCVIGVPGTGFVIIDTGLGLNQREVAWNWQLPLGSLKNLQLDPPHPITAESDAYHWQMTTKGTALGELVSGSETGTTGWQALEYGQSQPTQRLQVRLPNANDLIGVTSFSRSPLQVNYASQMGLELEHDFNGVASPESTAAPTELSIQLGADEICWLIGSETPPDSSWESHHGEGNLTVWTPRGQALHCRSTSCQGTNCQTLPAAQP